jgi:hypothetical protein
MLQSPAPKTFYFRRSIPGEIYFLRSGERIKIGFSKNQLVRAAGLKTGLSHGVETMAIVRGTEREERRAHAFLDRFRQSGEWFDAIRWWLV